MGRAASGLDSAGCFTGVESARLTFLRVRDLWPEERLSPDRSWKMILEAEWVTAVRENGRHVWPPRPT